MKKVRTIRSHPKTGSVSRTAAKKAVKMVIAMRPWMIKRRTPYTVIGIQRKECIRCGAPAATQWNICADGNHYRPVCYDCDDAINRLVLEFMRHPNVDKILKEYERG